MEKLVLDLTVGMTRAIYEESEWLPLEDFVTVSGVPSEGSVLFELLKEFEWYFPDEDVCDGWDYKDWAEWKLNQYIQLLKVIPGIEVTQVCDTKNWFIKYQFGSIEYTLGTPW